MSEFRKLESRVQVSSMARFLSEVVRLKMEKRERELKRKQSAAKV
jgi:hypothetical protein